VQKIISGFELILNPARLTGRTDRHDFIPWSKQTKRKKAKGRIVSNDHLDPADRSAATQTTNQQKQKPITNKNSKSIYKQHKSSTIKRELAQKHKRSSQYQFRCPLLHPYSPVQFRLKRLLHLGGEERAS
jgi:hypothetical protein